MSDLISRQAAIDALYAEMPGLNPVAMDIILTLPSAQPEPSELARDIATIIENEMDMRAILRNADAEPCDFCANKDDCEDMRIYCPARGRE